MVLKWENRIWTKFYGGSCVQRSLDGHFSMKRQGRTVVFFLCISQNNAAWNISVSLARFSCTASSQMLIMGKFLERWLISVNQTFNWGWLPPSYLPALRHFWLSWWRCYWHLVGQRLGVLLAILSWLYRLYSPDTRWWCQQSSSEEEHCSPMFLLFFSLSRDLQQTSGSGCSEWLSMNCFFQFLGL